MDLITELGVGGILAILIIREVLNFVSKRNNKPVSNPPQPWDAKSGDVAAGFWMDNFRQLREQHNEILDCLRRIERVLLKGKEAQK